MGRREFLATECVDVMRRPRENEVREWVRREMVWAVVSMPFAKESEVASLRRQDVPPTLIMLRLLQHNSALRAAAADEARRRAAKEAQVP